MIVTLSVPNVARNFDAVFIEMWRSVLSKAAKVSPLILASRAACCTVKPRVSKVLIIAVEFDFVRGFIGRHLLHVNFSLLFGRVYSEYGEVYAETIQTGLESKAIARVPKKHAR